MRCDCVVVNVTVNGNVNVNVFIYVFIKNICVCNAQLMQKAQHRRYETVAAI